MAEKKSENQSDIKATPLLAQYLKLREEYPDYLLFFRLGDFYELFFEDARTASKVLDIALTKRGKYKGEDVPMCGVPFHACESYLAKLVHFGYKIAICEQTEDPKEAKKRGYKSIVNREVVRLVTAGTLTEDPLLEAKANNFLLSINKFAGVLGAAWMDISTGEFYTQEFKIGEENEIALLSMLLMRLMPSEILVPESHIANKAVYNLLHNGCGQMTVWPDERFNPLSTKKRLLSVYGVDTLTAFGDFVTTEVCAAGALAEYVEISQKGKMPLLQRLTKLTNTTAMEIDNATRRSLELTRSMKGTNEATLLKTIDRTLTSGGGRLLVSRLSTPLKERGLIESRLDMIEFFVKCKEARGEVRALLREVLDMERALARLTLGRGGPRDLQNINRTLELVPALRNIIHFKAKVPVVEVAIPPVLQAAMSNLGEHGSLNAKLNSALADDLPYLSRDGNFVRDGYSAALDSMRELKTNSQKVIAELQARYTKETDIATLRIKYNNVIGYFIEVPTKAAEQLLKDPNFIFRQSVLNAVRFTTTELTEMEDRIRSADEKCLALELEIYGDLVMSVQASAKDIIKAAQAFAEIDVAAGLADLAVQYNYCRPILDEGTAFEIIEGRHPVVEQFLQSESKASFVANDCVMGENDNNLWLLTGPNMAGKSTFLRQNAIIAIMAQMGSFVPAKSAHIGLINKIFSRVGAADDLARGQSTFMVEMIETAAILNQADERSFVILDEIGRGTATFDGLSIAWAVVEYLHNTNRCRTIFATHYHELTALKEKLTHLSLHCMRVKEFNGEVVFMHEVGDGAADRSYGIHVAQIAGLPPKVIKRAKGILQNLENQNKGMSPDEAQGMLPLFCYAREATEEPEVKISALEEALQKICPDELSPREALTKIYELKKIAQENL